VIYKIDRLSRSLADFVRLMDVLDKYGASFVSVTQTFDTSDSMGRLVLNILLTFAQFERELMSDRVRDKKAAMRRRGLFTGGTPPAGYLRLAGGKLAPDPEWADVVKEIFHRFPNEPASQLAKDLQARGIVTRQYRTKKGKLRGGSKIWPRTINIILKNPIYCGGFLHRGEWVEADVEPLVTRDQWERAQAVAKTRYPQVRDPVRNFLLGILHDELGRKMKILRSGPGRSRSYRYYTSESVGWARGSGNRKVLVEADRVEELALSALKAFLVDRVQLKQAILSLGIYSDEISQLLKRGSLAARRLTLMDAVQRRELILALVPRGEVTRSRLLLLVSCHELRSFLAWDGRGIFRKSILKPLHGADRFRLVYAPAFLVCGHPYFAFPVKPCREPTQKPDKQLVRLLGEAAEYRQFMLQNRDKSIGELAREKGVGPGWFARILRVNYLAPDIQTAIFDGSQPTDLTRRKILFGSLPLDWEQQRQLMGFN